MLDTFNPFSIGRPALHSDMANHRAGHVAKVEDETARIYTLSGGGMQRQSQRITVVWEDRSTSTVHEDIARRWFDHADRARLDHITEDEAQRRLVDAMTAQQERADKAKADRDAYVAKVSAWRDQYRDKIPTDAKAVIVAEMEIDQSDAMTDYFGTTTGRTVLLAFSSHTRDLFPELRKAARNFPETEHLADAPESAEHREKWSMGAGYYLKATGRYSTGWKVCKARLWMPQGRNDLAEALPYGEWMIPADAPKAARAERAETPTQLPGDAETVGGCTISEHIHTKKGFRMWIVEISERVERDEFDRLMIAAKDRRGWYSRKWGATPSGFAFKDQAKAREFAAMVKP